VASLIFTKDGKTLITGWSDGSILLSDTRSGDSRKLAGHKRPVLALALPPDGRTLASGSSDEMIQLWDLPSGALKPPIALGPLGDIWSLAFSPDGQRLAAGGRNTVVTIWDLLKTPVPENIDELSPKAWGNFSFSPNSKLMAAVCKGDVLKVWQTDSLRVVATLDNISYVMAFSPDSSGLLASNSREEPLWWKLEDNQVVPLPERGMSGVLCADVSPDRRLGILGHKNGTLQLVDIEAGKDLAQWPAHEGGVLSVRFADASGKVISGGRDRSVAVWDAISHKRIAWNPGEHRGAVCGLAYSTAARRIASGCGADMIKIWDPADLSQARASMPYHKGAIMSLDFSGDGKTLASGSEDRTVRLFNVSSAQEITMLPMDSPVRLVVFAPDGNSLAIVTDSGRLRLMRAATLGRAETLALALRK
jgi:WD40 repeat protein